MARKYNGTIRRDPGYFKPDRFRDYLTIKELAVKLKKDPSWIRRLEKRGKIPAPPRVKRGKLRIRLYGPEHQKEIAVILDSITMGPVPKSSGKVLYDES